MEQSPDTLAVFEQIARDWDHWTNVATESLTNPSANLSWADSPEAFRNVARAILAAGLQPQLRSAISEILRGQIHSLLVVIDGGTSLAERVELSLLANGAELPAGLHERWVNHLLQTGRLT